VSNPPYVAVGDPDLEPSVEKWEPHLALFGGADGLNAYREVIAGAKEWLAPGGSIALEMGHHQADEVSVFLSEWRFSSIQIATDIGGRSRVVRAT